jgi:hypothetical protein
MAALRVLLPWAQRRGNGNHPEGLMQTIPSAFVACKFGQNGPVHLRDCRGMLCLSYLVASL